MVDILQNNQQLFGKHHRMSMSKEFAMIHYEKGISWQFVQILMTNFQYYRYFTFDLFTKKGIQVKLCYMDKFVDTK